MKHAHHKTHQHDLGEKGGEKVIAILRERGYNVSAVLSAVNRPYMFARRLIDAFWSVVHEVNPRVKAVYR